MSFTRSLKKMYFLSYWPFVCKRSTRKAKHSSTVSVLFPYFLAKNHSTLLIFLRQIALQMFEQEKKETSKGFSFRSLQCDSTDSKNAYQAMDNRLVAFLLSEHEQ